MLRQICNLNCSSIGTSVVSEEAGSFIDGWPNGQHDVPLEALNICLSKKHAFGMWSNQVSSFFFPKNDVIFQVGSSATSRRQGHQSLDSHDFHTSKSEQSKTGDPGALCATTFQLKPGKPCATACFLRFVVFFHGGKVRFDNYVQLCLAILFTVIALMNNDEIRWRYTEEYALTRHYFKDPQNSDPKLEL